MSSVVLALSSGLDKGLLALSSWLIEEMCPCAASELRANVADVSSARFKYIIYIIKYVHMTVTTIYPSSWGAHDPKKKRNEK